MTHAVCSYWCSGVATAADDDDDDDDDDGYTLAVSDFA